MSTIRVMLVDDHAVVRTGLATFLAIFDDLELVAEASSGEQALSLAGEQRPDVVLMDLVMPGMDGVTTTRKLRELYPEIRVVALTSFREEELVQAALQAGAIGYLLKDIGATALAEAVRAAHRGQATLAPEAAQALIQAAQNPPAAAPAFTEREREVLRLMVQGMSNAEIAESLVVSTSTVKFHVSNILSKLGAGSRTEAVAIALQEGLV
ncbi:MAG: response regulator transcription factor [Anaerolineae bacterium]|nr:response regulator transcription factor [Anaerolineae bacterium]